MKYLLLLAILSLVNLAIAQKTGEFKFQIIADDGESPTADTLVVEIAQTKKKFAINYYVEDVYERLVVDSIAQKVVELTNEDGEKTAFVADLSLDEGYGFTTAYDIVEQEMLEEGEYRLLTEKKTIQGWECKKIEFLDEGKVFGSGWLAPGLHIGYSADGGFFHTKEGTVLEYTIKDDEEGGSLTMKLIKSSKTITDPAKAFSLEVPAGYTIDTMEDDYYDGEDYYDEEGE
ncbi:MAG TPA: hypothetical protein VK151_14720 [Fluviicola sp.]|nr:hypothetical protein [Fluviicola sp.]